MTYFKVLNADRSAAHGGTGKWKARGWMPTIPDPVPCQRGYHLCRENDLVFWLGETIWEAEPGDIIIEHGTVADGDSKVVTEKARLLRRLPWDERTARLFAADCAEHVAKYANPATQKIIRATLEVVRRYADEQATEDELNAARAAAWAARTAGDAARIAGDAARAAWIAGDAARAAARAAWIAGDAARAAARAAARDAEYCWQARRLMTYLYP